MRFSPLNLLPRWHHGRDRFHGHHGHRGQHQHGHPGRRGYHGGGDRLDRMMARLSARLDLNTAQQTLLNELLTQLDRERRSWALASTGADLPGLLATESFDREAAQQLLNARLAAVSSAGTGLIAAAADLFDSLDVDQQQALRFMLRVRRGRAC